MLGFMISSASAPRLQFGVSRTESRNIAEESVEYLEKRLETLELACAGLWELLKTQHGYSDEQLVQAIRTVDARDGAVDGKIGVANRTCPKCHRQPLTRHSTACSWCGEPMNPAGL